MSNPEFIRKTLTVVGGRIAEELKGKSCLDLETDIEDQKQIISSRSFGYQVKSGDEIKESIANHVTSAAEKLRRQNLICKNLTVFIQTNPFKSAPHYSNSASIDLLSGTAVINKLIKQALRLIDEIFKEGYEYKKCGVIFNNLIKADYMQANFFGNYDSVKESNFMKVVDQLNRFHGTNTVKFAACGVDQFWKMLSEMKSPCYTTRWNELKKV
ncbi:MAG: DUF4113 domain-containing protein [Pseudobdellovibrio sp.]